VTRKIIFILLFLSSKTFAQNPVASFSFYQNVGEECVSFTDASTGNIALWTWYANGYLISQSSTSFIYCFSDTGCYDIKLVVQDVFGISDSVTQQVCIHLESLFFMPNAFTPNSDYINDVFYVYATRIPENKFEMRIYDYWGGLVFASFDVYEGWNGSAQHSGQTLPVGYYLIEIIWFDTNNEKHTYKGAILLMK
jgi:gliding motility-associated-like protein